jgi:exopolysaccharide biosynthesis polyprenyl glycosylphosphotransferase
MQAKRIVVQEINNNPLVITKNKGYNTTKRIFDILLASIGVVLTLPIIMITAVLIKLESKGPVFFLQERVGLNGELFKIYKLRSMSCDAEKNGQKWAEENDPRVTKVGKFIRKTRIDELPQFINVLKGNMSLIGPRPEIPMLTEEFEKGIPGFKKRLAVKPGLTGWAQVNGGYDISPREKLWFDLYYINNYSILLDIKIIFKTIQVILNGHGAR